MTNFKSGEPEFTKPTLTQHSVEEAIRALEQRGFILEKKSADDYRINGKPVTGVDLINVAFHGKAL